MITVQRCNGFDAIDADQWNRLVAASATHTVFQTYQWNRAWWETLRADDLDLALLIARDDDAPVGIAALTFDSQRVVRFVGHGRSDYADFICPVGRDDIRSALLTRAMDQCDSWTRIQLRNLPDESPTLKLLETTSNRVIKTDTVPCPTLLIKGNEEYFHKVRNKKSLRRHHNYFRKQPGYRVEHLRRADEILPQLDLFFDQHVARWASVSQGSLFQDEVNRRFYRALTRQLDETTWLRFTRIAIGDRPIAFHFGFAFEGVFFWYKPSFDPDLKNRSPGEALIKELFELAASEGLDEFDFTIGDEAFKQRFANHTRQNTQATLYKSLLDHQLQSTLLTTKQFLSSRTAGRPISQLVKRLGRQ